MTDDNDRSTSGSGSDSEDVETTGLIATRQKRSTAGNRYAFLLANLDDEELQEELFAEDEADGAIDYQAPDKDGDDDEGFESSSEEEDAGPPKEGEADDLTGERELKSRERADARKKRKLQDMRLKLPAWQKKKRVKLADDVKTEDGSSADRPRKKSERANWLPTPADAPTRQSRRSLAVANREVVHANLQQSYERSEKQRRVMQNAAERENARKRADLSQGERMKMAAKIEKQTERDFGRWERREAERQRIRDEQLAAKRRRVIDGPVVRYWSGSVLWEGDRIKVRRMSHGSRDLEEMKQMEAKRLVEDVPDQADGGSAILDATTTAAGLLAPETPSTGKLVERPTVPVAHDSTAIQSIQEPVEVTAGSAETAQPPAPWLQGIHDYASQPPPASTSHSSNAPITPWASNYIPNTPAPHVPHAPQSTTISGAPPQTLQPLMPFQSSAPQIYHGWPPGSQAFPTQPSPPAPAAPALREQAQRSLIILQQFEDLDNPPPRRNKPTSTLEPTSTGLALLGTSAYPTFTAEETRYLTGKHKKRGNEQNLAPPPAKLRCAITSWPAKFRDPKTGLPYADMHTYKILQRILAGGCQWSGLLGAWVGPRYGSMGRPATGVPEGFARPVAVAKVKAEEGAA